MNANQALKFWLKELLEVGADVPSRVGNTKELAFQSFTVTDPQNRYITLPGRSVSVPAQIAETMWVLAGRNDTDWLSAYLPQAPRFADDGKHWRAGYGPRLREWGDRTSGSVDQLKNVIELLRNDPTTRRAVISLWDPASDVQDSLDIPCLAGETILWSPEGDLPISELSEKFSSGEVSRWPVYAVDTETRKQRIQWATAVWQSGVKPTVRLTFDDGSDLRITPDHRLYIKKRVGSRFEVSEILAGDLKPGDRVLATHHSADAKGYRTFKRELDQNTSFSNMVDVHREYASLLYGDLLDNDVHHVNEIKTDNRGSNLEVLSHAEHSALKMLGDRNPMRQMDPALRAAKGVAHSAAITGQRRSPETRELIRQKALAREARKREMSDNHVVVSVEDGGTVPVYDFTVPGFNTALVGTGVVAHNCNNWLHFLYRGGKLHLNIATRSNDVMWGWSGINFFEWSVILEIVAKHAGLPVGDLHFNVSSMHLYERHFEKAKRIVEAPLVSSGGPGQKISYCGGPQGAVAGDLDKLIAQWFQYEADIRKGELRYIERMPDPLLWSWLWAIAYYWGHEEVALQMLGDLDIVAALKLSPKRKVPVDLDPLIKRMQSLHTEKSAAYGDSWKKRGELFSIIPNIARKVDRILAETETSDETKLDTAMDLVIYLAKYWSWLEGSSALGSENDMIDNLVQKRGSTTEISVGAQTFESFLAAAEEGDQTYKREVLSDLTTQAVGHLVKLWTGPEGRAMRNEKRSWNPEVKPWSFEEQAGVITPDHATRYVYEAGIADA